MYGKLFRRKQRIAWIAFAVLILAGGLALSQSLVASSTERATTPVPGNSLPRKQLPGSAGFSTLDGMSQIVAGRVPLWMEKDGTGPYSENSVGLLGSLQQGFVLRSAISKFGSLNAGLQLPLPLKFASQRPGPAEIFDEVWEFSNSWAPVKILENPAYTDSGGPGTIAMVTGTIDRGLAWKVESAANGGMNEFRFEWARGNELTAVSVIGADLTLAEARAVASTVGSAEHAP